MLLVPSFCTQDILASSHTHTLFASFYLFKPVECLIMHAHVRPEELQDLTIPVLQAMSTSKTSFQLVSIELGDGKPAATLLRMSNSNRITLVMRQVHAALCPLATYTQFRLSASKQTREAIRTVEGPDCLWIYKYGATSSHSHTVNVISLATAIKACGLLGAHADTLDALHSLKEEGKYTILQTPEEVLAFNCTPDVNPPSLMVPLPLPDTSPTSPVTSPARRMRYGLPQLKPHLATSVVVTQQLAELKTWATTPIMLSRKGPPLKQVSWMNVLSSIWLFLGFCYKWMGVQEPCLQHYLQPKLLAAFMSFHIAMKHGSHTMRHAISTAIKVLAWWGTKPGGHDKGLKKLREEWLPNLSHQVSLACAKLEGKYIIQALATFEASPCGLQIGLSVPKPHKTAADLPAARDLLSTIQQQVEVVLAAIDQQGMTATLARQLQDVLLACSVFGHLPPIRISCIRTLVLPDYQGACHDPDCIHDAACHGNQLQRVAHQGLHMHLPHHKNESSWGRAAIAFTLPQELAKLMELHISQGHKLLTDYIGVEDECHVFVDRQGRPFSDSNFTIYWDKMLRDMGCPSISPSLCRQVFVHERRSAERVEGPADRGAAMVMGHSLAQWTKWYDLDFHVREAQQAVDAMASWRAALLATRSPTTQLGLELPATQQQQQQQHLLQPSVQPQPQQASTSLSLASSHPWEDVDQSEDELMLDISSSSEGEAAL